MATPSWLPTDSAGLVTAVIERAQSCTIELACLPHLRAAAEELVTKTPSTIVDPLMQQAWRPVLSGAMALMPLLLHSSLVVADAPRLYGSLLALIEGMTQADPDPLEDAKSILDDTRDLDALLRERAQQRSARRLADDEAKLDAAAAVVFDPAVVAQLDQMDRLVVEAHDVAFPLPVGAEAQGSKRPEELAYLAAGTLPELTAVYRCWATRDGWVEHSILDNERWHVFELRRVHDGFSLQVRLTTWIHQVSITIEFPHAVTATVKTGTRSATTAAPPPSITRPRLAALATATSLEHMTALVADRGLVFAGHERELWMFDPHASTWSRVAAPDARLGALVVEDTSLLALQATPVTLWLLDDEPTKIIVDVDRMYARCLARIGNTAYVAEDKGQILAVDLTSGAVNVLAVVGREPRGLISVGSTLYVVVECMLCSVDLTSGAVTDVLLLPRMPSGLATDGTVLYTLHSYAIGRVDLASRSFTQIAGQPDFGGLQLLGPTGGKATDGLAEVAVLESASILSHDRGTLWFTDARKLRRFDLATRYVTTCA